MKRASRNVTDTPASGRDIALRFIISASVALSVLAILSYFLQVVLGGLKGSPVGPLIMVLALAFFWSLRALVGRGHHVIASIAILGTYALAAFWLAITSGFDVQQGLLLFALIIFLSNILFPSKVGIYLSCVIMGAYATIAVLEQNGTIVPRSDWRGLGATSADIVVYSATFGMLIVIAWLFNRGMERSLARALASEAELKRERDMLELRVEERADQLKRAQFERMFEIYRFADMGRHASGLFHDIVNPLTALTLRVEQLYEQSREGRSNELKSIAESAKEALEATKRIERFVDAARRQIRHEDVQAAFSPREEIDHAVSTLAYAIRAAHVSVSVDADEAVRLYGNPIKFYKVVQNLVTNAIDSYEGIDRKDKREIGVRFRRVSDGFELSVADSGSGIDTDELGRIYQPFYTTKSMEKGTGIGLTIVRDIIGQDFSGEVSVKSVLGKGTTFTVRIPASFSHDNEKRRR